MKKIKKQPKCKLGIPRVLDPIYWSLVLGSIIIFTSQWATARTRWPEGIKLSYMERCAESMSSQGLPFKTAKAYCSCIANGMEKEFGLEEYDQMMKAQPNPEGSLNDRRLYKIFSECSYLLPR